MKNREKGITIFRLIIAFLVIRNVFQMLPFADLLLDGSGMASYERYLVYLKEANCSWLAYPFSDTFSGEYYLWGIAILAFLFSIGVGRQISGVLLFFGIFNLQMRNSLMLDGSDSIILISLPFLILADNYKRFSVMPNFFLKDNNNWKFLRNVAAIGLMIQISIVYFTTGIVKLFCETWADGTAIYYVMRMDEFIGSSWNFVLTDNYFFVKFSTYSTLVFEVLFPFLILYRPTKYLALIAGVFFHLGIWIFMKIDVFPWIMIATYFVFISDEEYKSIYDFCAKKMSVVSLKPAFLVLMFLLSSVGIVQAQTGIDELEAVIDTRANELPGIAVAVVYNDTTMVFTKGNAANNRPVTNETIFEIGSITKTFTTLMLSMSVEEGKVRLNDKVSVFFPDLKKSLIGDLSLLELATHTSGLPANPKNINKKGDSTKGFTSEKLISGLRKTKLRKRGEFRYSNTGIMLLGEIMEKVQMTNYETHFDNINNRLLHMNNTNFVNKLAKEYLADGYDSKGRLVNKWQFEAFNPAGGLHSTIEDMLQYLLLNMQISSAVKEDPRLNTIGRNWHKIQIYGKDNKYNTELGWISEAVSDEVDLVWHNGETNGFSSYLGYLPQFKVGVVILSNQEGGIDEIGSTVLNLLIKMR